MTEDELWASRRRRAFRILKAFKIPFEEVDKWVLHDTPSWDGETFRFDEFRTAFDILHEACHWLVAPKTHRKWDNFGLGRDPWSGPAVQRVSFETAHDWEISACVMDVALAFHLRWDGQRRASDVSMDQERAIRSPEVLMSSCKPDEIEPTLKFLRNDGRLRASFAARIDSTKERP